MDKKSVRLFLFIVGILLVCILLRLFPTIELSNVNDIEDTTQEVEVERKTLDINKYKNKKGYTVIDDTVYERITDEDRKRENSVIKIVNGRAYVKIYELDHELYNWDDYEIDSKDISLDNIVIDEFRSK